MNILQVQQQIEEKNQELSQLESEILASQNNQQQKEHLQQQKERLKKELRVLEEKLNELQSLETHREVTQSQEQTNKLKQDIVVEKYSTNDIIKMDGGSTMYKKLLEIGKTPEEIEIFGNTIYLTVKQYLDQELLGFSEEIRNNMSVGIQFAMMDALVKDGANGVDFFENFSKNTIDNKQNTLMGFFGVFNTSDIFFQLANKVQNITQYLNTNKAKIPNQSLVPELNNPYKFMKLLQQDTWKNINDFYTKDISTVFTLDSSDGVRMTDDDIKKLWEIVNNEGMNTVITPKSIQAIEKSLITAQKILYTRGSFKSTASSLFSQILGGWDKISTITIPFFGDVGSLVGEWPIELLDKQITTDKKNKKTILDFILTGLGFGEGLQGLHKSYVMEGLDPLMVEGNKRFVSDVYSNYQKKATIVSHTDPSSTGQILASLLNQPNFVQNQSIIDKLPADYIGIKKALITSLDNDIILSKPIIQQFYPESNIYREDGSVDISLIGDKDAFVEKYLQYILPKLVNSGDTFIKKCPDSDTFLITVAGFLVGGKYFQEAMRLGLISGNEYGLITKDTTSLSQNNQKIYYDGIKTLPLSTLGLTRCKLSETEYASFTQKVVQIAKRLGINPEYLMKVMAFETGGTFDPAIKNAAGSGATGLIQFMPSTATGMGVTTHRLSQMTALQQLDYVERYFLPYKNKLDTLEDVYLAVFTPAFIGKPLDHIAYSIGSPAYEQNKGFDLNKDGKMTITEITQKIRQNTNKYTFFDVPFSEFSIEKISPPSKILAKNFDELMLVGDSHAGGIKGGLLDNQKTRVFYKNGLSTAQLLAKIGEEKNKKEILPIGTKSMILVTGANDITHGKADYLLANLEAIKQKIAPVQLVLTTVTYANNSVNSIPRTNEQVDKVNAIIREFAQKAHLPLIDINANISFSSNEYADSVHLQPAGYRKIAEHISDVLSS